MLRDDPRPPSDYYFQPCWTVARLVNNRLRVLEVCTTIKRAKEVAAQRQGALILFRPERNEF